MNARTTDPSSSEERVTDIVTDTDRIDGLAVLEAIREAGWSIPGDGTRWFTDDDIKDQYDRNIGHGDTTRNDLARHRLRWEQQNPPALVRDPTPRAPLSGGRAVLHFRLAREGDQPRPTLLRTLGKAGDRVEDGGEWGTLKTCPTCDGQGLLHEPDVRPEPVQPVDIAHTPIGRYDVDGFSVGG